MRLERLSFEAIGPFAGRHDIDFAALTASGLFLLEGPTGAGKSTVIDAIVFALYGQPAVEGSDPHRLRSDHADPAAESWVELAFEVPSGHYRVRRTPKFERSKLRGDGTTTQPASVKLWRRLSPDGPEDLVSARVDEAAAEVQRAIGLTREQFVQTVVLPQGQFAAFLHATTDDRRKVLQRVFGTEFYERWQAELKERRTQAAGELRALGEEVARAARGFAAAAGLDDASLQAVTELAAAVAEGREASATLTAEAADVGQALEGSARAWGVDVAAAEAAVSEATQAHADARTALERLTARRQVEAELAALAEGEAARAADRERIAAARRAAPVEPVLAAAARATATLAAAERAAAEQAVDLGPDGTADPWRDAWVAAQGERTQADDRVQAVDAWEEARKADGAAAAAWAEARRAQQAAADRLTAAETAAQRWADQGPEARSAVARAEARLAAAAEREAAAAALTSREAELAAALAAHAGASAAEAELRERRQAGMGAELAAGLAAGEPCPVCGSTTHPAPAQPGADHIGRDEVDQAARATGRAAHLVEAARAAREAAGRRVAELAGAAGGVTEAEAAAALAAAQAALAELGDEAVLRLAVEQASGEVERRRHEAVAAEAAATAAHDRSVALEARTGGLTAAAARAALAAAADRERAAEAGFAAATALVAARAADAEGAAALSAALAEAGFDTADAARAAYLPAAEITALDEVVRAAETQAAALGRRLAEPDLAGAAGSVDDLTARLAAAEAAAAAAQERAKEFQQHHAVARDRAAKGRRAGATLATACATLDGVRAAVAPVIRLADLATAGPGNRHGVELATYVLVRRFDEVVAAANDRLRPMSDGRFTLERSEDKGAGRQRKVGLGLRVLDALTGEPRDPRSLSGGETFYVSLALALGLADIVTAEAGGVDLGTLFIDEGFGALSAEVLDNVLAELGRLRAGGRAVGVVSHVDTLKQAIAERIEVRRRADGSSTLSVRA